MEQERSNSYIRSITTELERTRRELDLARSSAANAGVDSARLMLLKENFLKPKMLLGWHNLLPKKLVKETFSICRMNFEKLWGRSLVCKWRLERKKNLENQLLQLKSSTEDAAGSSTRSASPAYVNKLLLDLNAAKKRC